MSFLGLLISLTTDLFSDDKVTVMSTSQNIVESSVKAASLNMLTQLAFRVFTFLMNAFVLRHISPEVLGLIYVRLNLLDDTIIFLSTEGFRLAGLGHKTGGSWQKTINLMWLCLPVSLSVHRRS